MTLAESNVNLDDVVVIGYGSQKKESVVASINSIKPADIAVPTRSLSNSIAGRVAGVVAIQRSGEPGNDDASFWIRGQSSYMGGTNPLILVDGVPRDMNDIDVDEIETFTVLKDAAATPKRRILSFRLGNSSQIGCQLRTNRLSGLKTMLMVTLASLSVRSQAV